MGDISVRDIYADKVLVANTINQVELKRYLDRAVEGSASRQDLEAIDRELITGGIRDASISIVADTIQTVRNVTEIYSAADAPSVLALLDQREKLIEGDRARAEQKAYFAAVNNLATRSPYRFKQASQNLGETYVPLLFSTVNDGLDTAGRAENGGLNLADALRGHACVALIARAGAGKSTLLRHLALNAWADPASIGLDRPHLPMLVKLRHLAAAAGATIEERLWRAIEAARDIAIGGAPIVAGFMQNWQR